MILFVSFILFLFSLLGITIAVLMVKDYQTVQGRYLGMILFSSSAASFAYGMEILSPGLNEKFTWVVVRYAALTIFVLANALFVFYITHIPIRLKSWRFLALCLLPAVALFSQATYPLNHLVYDRIWLDTSGPIPMIAKSVGPLYWFYNLYVIGLLLTLVYLVLNNMARESKLNRMQSLLIAIALMLVGVTHLLHLGGVNLLGVINPNLFTYFPVAAIILWGTKRYRLADIRPIARTLLLEQMQDGILVVDRTGNLIDTNPAAEHYLHFSQKDGIGRSIQKISDELSRMLLELDSHKVVSSVLYFNAVPLQVTINPLQIQRGEDAGFLIILRDISDRMDAEQLKEIEIKRQSAWLERQNIARILHDSINQYLHSLVLLTSSASQRLEQLKYDQLELIIGHISTSARLASREMREFIIRLQLESPSDQGFYLPQQLAERIDLFRSNNELHFNLDSPGTLTLNSTQQREIFYILLEALNNIVQHAQATTVSIRLQEIEGQFVAEIQDDGCGFDFNQGRKGGMGLSNIKARASQLSGTVTIESSPGAGTLIRVVLPLVQLFPVKEKTG
ncbi:MAG: histidine kinase N-terminal 7TM domain-containing protein [Chloroflexota bacterium]